MKKTSFVALIIAILFHIFIAILLWALYLQNNENKNIKPKQDNRIKISLKEMPKSKKKSGDVKKKIQKTHIAPPMPKGKQLKKIINKAPIKYEPNKPTKEPQLNKKSFPMPTPTKAMPKVEKFPVKDSFIPVKTLKKKEKDPMAWMYEDKSDKEPQEKKKKELSGAQAGGTIQEMKDLYGEEWGRLTYGQQKYMLDNQEIMRRITQEILTRVARVNLTNNIRVNRKNVIEFYLHPNGDMSDFKFLSKSGYYVLDDTTRETIEYAYSRYPRPKEKILIRYNVYYHLASY